MSSQSEFNGRSVSRPATSTNFLEELTTKKFFERGRELGELIRRCHFANGRVQHLLQTVDLNLIADLTYHVTPLMVFVGKSGSGWCFSSSRRYPLQ